MFEIIDPNDFLVQFNVLLFFMIILLNINALAMYCRNAGNPYLNDKCKRYVRNYKCVIIFWNVAFIIKIVLSSSGATIADIETAPGDTDDFWYSVEQFANILLTEIVPFYFVIDRRIVKIMTLKFLENEVPTDFLEASGT